MSTDGCITYCTVCVNCRRNRNLQYSKSGEKIFREKLIKGSYWDSYDDNLYEVKGCYDVQS